VLKVLLSTVSYILLAFPLALGWHVGLFKDKYERFGYFEGNPNIPVGLATIVIQGFALALIYPLFHTGSAGATRALQFVGLLGLFFWTSHVLALVAKRNVPDAAAFILMETLYLAIQFGLYAVALTLLFPGAQ